MKTLSLYAGVVAIVFAAAFSSCSDDTLVGSISLPDGTPSQVTLSCENVLMSVPVEASGDWTATVVYDGSSRAEDPEELSGWLGLITESGNGNATVDYTVDANNTPDLRSATIVITSGDKTIEYKVLQQPVGYGDDNEDIDMSMFKKQVPLGYGIRMRKVVNSKDVSNILLGHVITVNGLSSKSSKVKALVDKFELSPSEYVSVDSANEVSATLIEKQSLENSSREILANLKVNVAYGLFKLNLNGNFKMFGSSDDQNFNFSVLSAPKKGSFRIDESILNLDLASLEIDDSDDAATAKDKKSARKLIFSNKFIELHDSIEKYVAKGKTYQDTTLNKHIRTLDNTFGPAYIIGADMGGSAELNYLFAMKEGIDTLSIKGDLTIGLNSLLKLDVSASAAYNNYMKSHLKECSFNYSIKGGDGAKQHAFESNLVKLMKVTEEIDASVVQNAISDWAHSLKFANSTCLAYTPEPIWTLFSDEAAEQLMHYFWDSYPNNGKSCPYTFDVRHIITELNGGYEDSDSK